MFGGIGQFVVVASALVAAAAYLAARTYRTWRAGTKARAGSCGACGSCRSAVPGDSNREIRFVPLQLSVLDSEPSANSTVESASS